MRKVIRSGRARLVPRVAAELAQRLSDLCASQSVTETAVVEAALRQYLDGTSDGTLILRRLDRLGGAIDRDHRDLQILSVAFGVFVRMWFAHTRSMPDDEKRAARRIADARYTQFVEHVAQQFSGGRRFLDDLPREPLADDGELGVIAGDKMASKEQG